METKEAQPNNVELDPVGEPNGEAATLVVEEKTTVNDEPPTPSYVLKEADIAMAEWNSVAGPATSEAKDLYYYAQELWCEDKHEWSDERRKVLRDKLTVDQFDKDLEALSQKQAPVWEILLTKEAALRTGIDVAHDKVKKAHANIKKALMEDPLNRKFMNPLAKVFGKTLHKDQQELNRYYKNKLKRQFQDSEETYVLLCGYPSGLLTSVKLFRANAIKESAHVAEEIHKKKGLVHEVIPSPTPVST